MNHNPLVSVIVPCYNQGSFLNKALQSVYDQSYENWECLVVDDGSNDSTSRIAQTWTSEDNRFKYFYKENGGLASARNLGLDKASGNFIQFLDSDDFLHKYKLGHSLELLQHANTFQVVISNYLQYNDFAGKAVKPHFKISRDILTYDNIIFNWDNNFAIPIHCGLFSSDLFNEFRFPENLKAKEDWLMWIKFFQKDITVQFIAEALAYYRRHDSNMTNKVNMTIDYVGALRYIRKEIPDEDYIRMLELKVERSSNTIFSLRDQIKDLRSNLGWRFFNKLGKILKR
ncbi:glycosyltransferase [Gramella lutea]|uniref:Glycosyltransferase n=1 Tax=Christiangramia lutea TaxID=1607951 RepID=A0A9X1V0H4_9FLAO|nr:glycosyltransferase family 2 protein [Christiangramia lutea]MCH4821585.1 glycosyltransferase [Christiangramia lutea]